MTQLCYLAIGFSRCGTEGTFYPVLDWCSLLSCRCWLPVIRSWLMSPIHNLTFLAQFQNLSLKKAHNLWQMGILTLQDTQLSGLDWCPASSSNTRSAHSYKSVAGIAVLDLVILGKIWNKSIFGWYRKSSFPWFLRWDLTDIFGIIQSV